MKIKPCHCAAGLLFLAGSAMAATQVTQEPLHAFGYHNSTAQPSLSALLANRWDSAAGDRLSTNNPQLDERSLRSLEEQMSQPRALLPRGLIVRPLPGGSQLTAAGPFAPPIPGDPHADQARFTMIGLNW